MSLRYVIVASLIALSAASRADDVLYRYEGDVLPYDPSAGWLIVDRCELQCAESVESGHFVLRWGPVGNSARYHYWVARSPDVPPPTLWAEWRFRSNHILGQIFYDCDASFSVVYTKVADFVFMW
jgi:hypothetical protein